MNRENLRLAIALRHTLHQHPELSGKERWTKQHLVAFIKEHTALEVYEQERWFYAVYRNPECNLKKKRIAFRADFDAIKMDEEIKLPYASQNNGVAHKCGHDGHSAILAALALEIDQKGCKADIFFLFQFGEENGTGAKECVSFIEENGIDEIYALHNMSGVEQNAIYIKDGITHYTSTGIIIELKGTPCHASEPEKGKNPASALSKIVLQLDNILAKQREVASGAMFCTVIQIALGEEAFGISAAEGRLLLTIRSEYDKDLKPLQNAIEDYAKKEAITEQLLCTVQYMDYFPETYNHKECCDAVRKLRMKGFDIRELEKAFRTSEDFGYYLKKTKGAMFYLGNGINYPSIHTSQYDFNDRIIETGVEAFKALIEV